MGGNCCSSLMHGLLSKMRGYDQGGATRRITPHALGREGMTDVPLAASIAGCAAH
jgi:hypothetical protein